jgi:hypothetical protein
MCARVATLRRFWNIAGVKVMGNDPKATHDGCWFSKQNQKPLARTERDKE